MSQPRKRYVRKCNASTSNTEVVVANARAKVVVVETIKAPLIEPPQGEREIPESEAEDDDFWPISGKPHFEVVLTMSHLNSNYQLIMPAKICRQLPSATVPVVITCRGKKWRMVYSGDHIQRRIKRAGWKDFAVDNNLKIGDACVFELVECNNDGIQFKAQILRGDFPSELLERINGLTEENPIKIQ